MKETIAIYIDLIIEFFNEKNPILISDLIKAEFNVRVTIHQIMDYLDINRKEDYESESLKQYYNFNY